MLRAIKVNDSTRVFVTFQVREVTQLTAAGFSASDMVVCYVHNANDKLDVIGVGMALRAVEDSYSDEVGGKYAFERAVVDAFPLDKEARVALHASYRSALVQAELGF
jgi:hypothetical protein